MKMRVEVSYNTSTRGVATELLDGVTDVHISAVGQLLLSGKDGAFIAGYNTGSWVHAKSVEIYE